MPANGSSNGPPAAEQRASPSPATMPGRFALFGECLLAGVLTVLAALPVLTLLAALAAGCAHVRAHAVGEGETTVAAFLRRYRAAWRGSAGFSALLAGTALLITFDLVIVRAGLPGATVVLAGCVCAALLGATAALRAAAAWRPGLRWRELIGAAVRRTRTDLTGTAMAAAALVATAAGVWASAVLLLPMTGCLLLAAVVIDRRAPHAR
ncbi:hypothetical protein GCM10022402_05890 [Salinactinospora qingdaonensis]|uniref:Membrane protein YesL n=1 Tax=Salinactinospora qingdaonensis TaxID=702744 RepID=A0ABP7F4E5_9ACTN